MLVWLSLPGTDMRSRHLGRSDTVTRRTYMRQCCSSQKHYRKAQLKQSLSYLYSTFTLTWYTPVSRTTLWLPNHGGTTVVHLERQKCIWFQVTESWWLFTCG